MGAAASRLDDPKLAQCVRDDSTPLGVNHGGGSRALVADVLLVHAACSGGRRETDTLRDVGFPLESAGFGAVADRRAHSVAGALDVPARLAVARAIAHNLDNPWLLKAVRIATRHIKTRTGGAVIEDTRCVKTAGSGAFSAVAHTLLREGVGDSERRLCTVVRDRYNSRVAVPASVVIKTTLRTQTGHRGVRGGWGKHSEEEGYAPLSFYNEQSHSRGEAAPAYHPLNSHLGSVRREAYSAFLAGSAVESRHTPFLSLVVSTAVATDPRDGVPETAVQRTNPLTSQLSPKHARVVSVLEPSATDGEIEAGKKVVITTDDMRNVLLQVAHAYYVLEARWGLRSNDAAPKNILVNRVPGADDYDEPVVDAGERIEARERKHGKGTPERIDGSRQWRLWVRGHLPRRGARDATAGARTWRRRARRTTMASKTDMPTSTGVVGECMWHRLDLESRLVAIVTDFGNSEAVRPLHEFEQRLGRQRMSVATLEGSHKEVNLGHDIGDTTLHGKVKDRYGECRANTCWALVRPMALVLRVVKAQIAAATIRTTTMAGIARLPPEEGHTNSVSVTATHTGSTDATDSADATRTDSADATRTDGADATRTDGADAAPSDDDDDEDFVLEEEAEGDDIGAQDAVTLLNGEHMTRGDVDHLFFPFIEDEELTKDSVTADSLTDRVQKRLDDLWEGFEKQTLTMSDGDDVEVISEADAQKQLSEAFDLSRIFPTLQLVVWENDAHSISKWIDVALENAKRMNTAQWILQMYADHVRESQPDETVSTDERAGSTSTDDSTAAARRFAGSDDDPTSFDPRRPRVPASWMDASALPPIPKAQMQRLFGADFAGLPARWKQPAARGGAGGAPRG